MEQRVKKNFDITFENGWRCVFSPPTKQVINAAFLKLRTDGKQALIATILERCWISGNEEVKKDDGCLLYLFDRLDEICDVISCESICEDGKTILMFEDGVGLVLKAPTRLVINEATNKSVKAPLATVEYYIMHCTIEGDKQKVLNDASYLLGANGCMKDIEQKKTATLVRV
jgi:hypothetical protein